MIVAVNLIVGLCTVFSYQMFGLISFIVLGIILIIASIILLSYRKTKIITNSAFACSSIGLYVDKSPQTFLVRLYIVFFALLLLGYALLGKGFAYIHITFAGIPLYVGEIMLAAGILTIVFGRVGILQKKIPMTIIVFLAWALLGAISTFHGFNTYGLDALRDAAIWYYGFFMIIAYYLFSPKFIIRKLSSWYVKFLFFIVVLPGALMLWQRITGKEFLPDITESSISLSTLKSGVLVVQVGMALVVVMMFQKNEIGETVKFRYLLTIFIGLNLFILLTANRSGILAIFCMLLLFYLFYPVVNTWKITSLLVVLTIVFLIINPQNIGAVKENRDISVNQIIKNIQSIVVNTKNDNLTDPVGSTAEWRLKWWKEIIKKTIANSDIFWYGKGFGNNMADEMGYANLDSERPLRSPHNINLTILYRMGVPGFSLWLLLNAFFTISISFSIIKARKLNMSFNYSCLILCLCGYVLSHVVAFFDVHLENSMGAIWFWTLMGIGISLAGQVRGQGHIMEEIYKG